ncbi:MAG: sensor histidine kinase [Firmicutes bacterium]|jgi:two-component system sensor histidine kinase YesM|nr:sensor histidine kinase [Bacillota bacterium]
MERSIKFYHSLRFRLSLVILIFTIFPSVALYMVYVGYVKEVIAENYIESAVQSVSSVGQHMSYVFNDMVEFSNVILTNRDFTRALNYPEEVDVGSFRSLIRSFFTSREDIDGIYVYTPQDTYYVGAVKSADVRRSVEERLAHTSGEVVWIETKPERINIFSGQYTKYYFSLARKLIDLDTLQELGYLTIDIDELTLERLYRNLVAEGEGEVFVVTEGGYVISHTDKSMIGTFLADHPYMQTILSAPQEHGFVSFRLNDRDYFAIYSVCNSFRWRIVRTIPADYLFRRLDTTHRIILAALVLCCLIAMTAVVVFSVKTTQPITDMMHLMKQAERGNLSVRVNTARADEIGQLGVSFNHMIEKVDALIRQLVQEEREKKEMELEVLRAQINPHFLYNSLNTIRLMAKIQGDKSIAGAITALIKLLRISVDLGRDLIVLQDEIEYVKNYILLQRLRFNQRFSVEYFIDDDCLDCLVPKLILQPIVENSIIYGSENDGKSDLRIVISAAQADGLLTLSVVDNGPGIDGETLQRIFKGERDKNRFSTAGLNNVNQRVQIYFGTDYGVQVDSELNSWTKVTVTMPVKKAEDDPGEFTCIRY